MFLLEQIGLMVGVTTVFVVVIAVPLYFVLKKMDRRVKDGPRCRACGYDLRANRGEACIECGHALSPKGVWPVGKPTRGPAIIAAVLWSWLLLITLFPTLILWQEYDHRLLQRHDFSTDMMILETDDPDKPYSQFVITAAGSDWALMPGDKPASVRLEQVLIWVYGPQTELEVVAFDPATGKIEEPLNPIEQFEAQLIYGSTKPATSLSAEAYLTQSLQQQYADPALDGPIQQDVAQVMELATRLAAAHKRIGYEDVVPYAMDTSVAHALSEPLRFARVTQPRWQELLIEYPPWWFSLVILGVFFIIWAVGLSVIRKRIYERMAVDGVPEESGTDPTDQH